MEPIYIASNVTPDYQLNWGLTSTGGNSQTLITSGSQN